MKYSAMISISLSVLPLIPLRFRPEIGNKSYPLTQFRARKRKLLGTISCSNSDNSSQSTPSPTQQQQQQLNLSVLRFTFGIPGLDESYLPRWIGYAFGSLLLLNHFAGSESSAITPAQLRTEVLGLSLAAFSIIIPYLGKFLKGATPSNEKNIPEGAEQIFLMSPSIIDNLKEDLAWGTYILLRNTNTVSVLILIQDALCVRGYWNTPKDITKDQLHGWFEKQINKVGLSDLKETLYFPQAEDMELWEMLPIGTCSLLVQPVLHAQNISSNRAENSNGFILLASSSTYAYSNKDRAWTRAVAKKFGGIFGKGRVQRYQVIFSENEMDFDLYMTNYIKIYFDRLREFDWLTKPGDPGSSVRNISMFKMGSGTRATIN